MSFTSIPLFNDNDPADLERMNSIISNLNYLNDSKLTMRYDAYGTVRTDNMKIAAGTIDVTTNGSSRTRQIFIPSFFTPNTRPVVNVSLASITRRRSFISVASLNATSVSLDFDGFTVHIETASGEPLTGGQIVNWMAVGY
jgi:hypothetical protein